MTEKIVITPKAKVWLNVYNNDDVYSQITDIINNVSPGLGAQGFISVEVYKHKFEVSLIVPDTLIMPYELGEVPVPWPDNDDIYFENEAANVIIKLLNTPDSGRNYRGELFFNSFDGVVLPNNHHYVYRVYKNELILYIENEDNGKSSHIKTWGI
jgi:hypothetical protein